MNQKINECSSSCIDGYKRSIRLGTFVNGKEILEDGAKFTLTTDDIEGTVDRATLTYKNLKNDVKAGSTVLIMMVLSS